jgi:hypothetical protein
MNNDCQRKQATEKYFRDSTRRMRSMDKPSMTVIGLAMGLAGLATVALAGGMPLEDDCVNKGSQPSVL